MSCRNSEQYLKPYIPQEKRADAKPPAGSAVKFTILLCCVLVFTLISVWTAYFMNRDDPGRTPAPSVLPSPFTEASGGEIVSDAALPSTDSKNSTASVREPPLPGGAPSDDLISQLPTVGATVENASWRVTLTAAKEYDELSGGSATEYAAEGKKLLVAFFDVENISLAQDSFGIMYLHAYLDGESLNPWITLNDPEGYKQISAVLLPTQTRKWCVVFQVPDDWQQLSLFYMTPWNSYEPGDIAYQVARDSLTAEDTSVDKGTADE